ncbi:hypothetical protein D3C73_1381520 [compost metagenome]
MEDGCVQVPGHICLQIVLHIPGDRCTVGESGIADRQVLPMAEIAPVGNQIADGTVIFAVDCGTAQIGHHVVGAARKGVPGTGSRTDIKRNSRFAEF